MYNDKIVVYTSGTFDMFHSNLTRMFADKHATVIAVDGKYSYQ